jgi:hypothetical protein
MPNTVQDRVKIEWEKAQEKGGQRVSRIREILGAAATEALAEIKEGSGEIEAQGRKTLAEMIEQLKAKEAAEAAAAAQAAETLDAEEEAVAAPSWGDILAELGNLANDRKQDWAQQLLASLQSQIDRFDADMATEYGDRYNLLRPLVRGFRSLVALAYGRVAQPTEPEAPAPVHIEVLDEAESPVDDSTQA